MWPQAGSSNSRRKLQEAKNGLSSGALGGRLVLPTLDFGLLASTTTRGDASVVLSCLACDVLLEQPQETDRGLDLKITHTSTLPLTWDPRTR